MTQFNLNQSEAIHPLKPLQAQVSFFLLFFTIKKAKHPKHYGPLSRQLASALCTDCTPSLTLRGVSQTARVLHALRVWWESSWPLCSHTFSGLSGWFKLLFVFQPSTGNASGRRKREAPKPQVSTSCTRVGYSYLCGDKDFGPHKDMNAHSLSIKGSMQKM